MGKNLLRLVGLFGFLAVILGAFGAHALESQLGPSQVETFKTGVQYHFYHTLALFLVALLMQHQPNNRRLRITAWCFILGILLFSGSLYLLSTRPISGLEAGWLGPITPIGGTFFIVGWLFLIISTFASKTK